MDEPSEEPQIIESAPLDGPERERALDLVEEIQERRETRHLKPAEVPKILLGYQARWVADKSRVRYAKKSRRVGFSWGCLAAEAALEAGSSKSAGGMDQHYMGYNMSMAAEFIGDCAFFCKAYGIAMSSIDVWRDVVVIENEKRDITRYRVDCASGHSIEALSSNPFNWRGRQGHGRIDEAAFHRDLKEVVKGVLAFLMWGGRADIVSTVNGEDNPFSEYDRAITAGALSWSRHIVTFDDALRDGFYKRVCLVNGWEWSPQAEEEYREETYADYPDHEDAAEELDCIEKRGSGAYFSRLIIEPCQDADVPVVRKTFPAEFVLDPERERKTRDWIAEALAPIIGALPKDRKTALGVDFGRTGDLSVARVKQEDDGGIWRVAIQIELRNAPHDVQRLIIVDYVLVALPMLKGAKFDSRGNGSDLAEAALQKRPGLVECVALSASWYAYWFPRYRAGYENRIFRVPAGEDEVNDHLLVVLKNGKPGMSAAKVKGADGKPRHGDGAVAGVLSYAAAEGDGTPAPAGASRDPEPEIKPLPKAMGERPRARMGLVGLGQRLFGRGGR